MDETPYHAICNCNFSKKVWKLTTWRESIKVHHEFIELLSIFFLDKRYENVELFAYITWLIWNVRNNNWHGKNYYTKPEEIILKATALLEEFKEANKKVSLKKVDRNVKWLPPPEGSYKLNTDGAVDAANGLRGLGAVLRNEKGELMGACATPFVGSFSPLITELLAIKLGLQFAFDTRTLPILVETDCSEAVRLINSSETCWSEEGPIIEDIKVLMYAAGVDTLTFQPRECNSAAHCVAKFALSEQSLFICIEDGPEWLMESINNDSNVCNLYYHQ